jgi:hypothetical protein
LFTFALSLILIFDPLTSCELNKFAVDELIRDQSTSKGIGLINYKNAYKTTANLLSAGH